MNRVQVLQRLKDSIFNVDRSAIGIRAGQKVLNAAPLKQRLLTYYPPDVDCVKLANQDPRLKPLDLQDIWLHKQVIREKRLEARGKEIRVSGNEKKPL